eukprot:376419_1
MPRAALIVVQGLAVAVAGEKLWGYSIYGLQIIQGWHGDYGVADSLSVVVDKRALGGVPMGKNITNANELPPTYSLSEDPSGRLVVHYSQTWGVHV